MGIQCVSLSGRFERGSDRHKTEAVSYLDAVNGHASGRDDSSPEDAGSRYSLGTKLRHFQKLLAVLPSDLIANASIVIVTTSNNPRPRLEKSLIEILVNRITFKPNYRELFGVVEPRASSEVRLRRPRASS